MVPAGLRLEQQPRTLVQAPALVPQRPCRRSLVDRSCAMASFTSPNFSDASVRPRSAAPVAAGKPHTRVRVSLRLRGPEGTKGFLRGCFTEEFAEKNSVEPG